MSFISKKNIKIISKLVFFASLISLVIGFLTLVSNMFTMNVGVHFSATSSAANKDCTNAIKHDFIKSDFTIILSLINLSAGLMVMLIDNFKKIRFIKIDEIKLEYNLMNENMEEIEVEFYTPLRI